MDYQGFGNGSDGVVTLTGVDAPIDSSSSGTGGTKSLSATNPSFASGKLILIHQSRGSGAGNLELNIIDSYVAGTITTQFDLVNTYTDSGDSQAQVIQLKEYSSVTITDTFEAKPWDGNVGGIVAYLCSGETNIPGVLSVAGKGFRGGTGVVGAGQATSGEGTAGAQASQSSANGNGGGGANLDGSQGAAGGGGGSNGTAGANGGYDSPVRIEGVGGSTAGSEDLATIVFGGGGGGGAEQQSPSGDGGRGGGIVYVLTSELNITGGINANGANGIGDGGAGAGGSVYIATQRASVGVNLITALGGSITSNGSSALGGIGGQGRIYIKSCAMTGSTNPGNPAAVGGYEFCQSFVHIY